MYGWEVICVITWAFVDLIRVAKVSDKNYYYLVGSKVKISDHPIFVDKILQYICGVSSERFVLF